VRLRVRVPLLDPLAPGLVQDVVHVLDVLVPPHFSMAKLECLERVVAIGQGQVLVLEDIGEQVLVRKLERLDGQVGVQDVFDGFKGGERGKQDDEARVKKVVGGFGEGGGSEGSRELSEGVAAVLGDPEDDA
jgi:hypothetical protein